MTTFTTGDSGPDLTGSVNTSVVGATIQLHLRKPDWTVLSVPAVIVDNTLGTWKYTWAATDLNVAGDWSVEAQVTFSNGTIETFGPAIFQVQGQIA